MAGLVGAFAPGLLATTERAAIRAMARTLDFTGTSKYDLWEDDHLAVCRIHHDFDPPAPAVVHRALDVVAILDGEIFDVEDHRGLLPETPEASAPRGNEALACLELYGRHGVPGLARLNGSFTLLLYDRGARRLLLASDRFASRPLFYHAGPSRLTFGTQARCVLLPDLPRRLHPPAVRQFLVFQTILDDRTPLEGVRTFPPAASMWYPSPSAPEPRRYWTLAQTPDEASPERQQAERLAAALTKSIRRCTRDADHSAVLLSGGLDSRTIVAAAEQPLVAVTLADFENREVELARAVASTRRFPLVFVRRSPNHYVDLADPGVSLGDGAYRYDHAHFAGLRGAIPEHLTSLVSAYWCDLLLKGSALPTRPVRIAGWSTSASVLADVPASISDAALTDLVLGTLRYCQWRHPALPGIFPPEQRDMIRQEVRELVGGLLRRAAASTAGPEYRYESVRLNMMATRSPPFLNVLSIRHFFRDQTITFDNAVLDEALRIPARLRAGGRLFRRAVRVLGRDVFEVPDANTGLRPGTPLLVEHARDRVRAKLRSLGLGRPPDPAFTQRAWPDMAELIRHRPALRERLAATLGDETALPPALFDLGAVRELLTAHLERRQDGTQLLLTLLTFGLWHRRVFAGESA